MAAPTSPEIESPSHPEEIIDPKDVDMDNAVLLGQGAFGTV